MAGTPANALNIPRPPVFATVAEERLHRKRMLAAAFRLFARFGFDEGVAGHITARDPEQLDHFWVNPFGKHFSQIRTSDLILVNHRGEVVEGNYPVEVGGHHVAEKRYLSGSTIPSVYRMLRYGMKYVDQGTAVYDAQRRHAQIKQLNWKAAKLGYQVVRLPAA
jgi:hypothetical protein